MSAPTETEATEAAPGWYEDKALWLSLFSIVLPIISKKLGVTFDSMEFATLAATVGGYMMHHNAGRKLAQ